jgi:hypothetical protein
MDWTYLKKYNIASNRRTVIVMVVVLLFFGYYYLQKRIDNRFRQKLDSAIIEISPFVGIHYEKIHVDFIGRKTKIQGIRVVPIDTNEKISIDELVINKCDIENNLPVRTNLELKGVHLSADGNLLKTITPYLFYMGYKDIVADFELAYTLDVKRHTFDIHNLTLEAGNVGALKLVLNLNNFDFTKILSEVENISGMAAACSLISIDTAELRYNDYSFFKKLVGSPQNQQIQTSIDFIHEAVRGIDHAIEKESSLPTKRTLVLLKDFMTTPDKIYISAKPDQPVPLVRLIWIKSLKDLIGLFQINIEI